MKTPDSKIICLRFFDDFLDFRLVVVYFGVWGFFLFDWFGLVLGGGIGYVLGWCGGFFSVKEAFH